MSSATLTPTPGASAGHGPAAHRVTPGFGGQAAYLPPVPAPAPRSHRLVPTWWRDAAGVLTWALMLFVVALWVAGGGIADIDSAAGALRSLGRLTGLVSSDLLLVQVLLMARIPFVEQAYGQDELTQRHRWVGFASFNLMWAHIVLILLGYAAGSTRGIIGTTVDVITQDPGMLLALAGTVALCMVVVTSLKKARGKLRYESWHLIHLYAYLGVGLALPHQLWAGSDFTANPVATVFWWGLWIAAVVAILTFRVGLPIVRNLRHRLVVTDVISEGPGVTSVVVSGRNLDRLPVRAGQFMNWRFRNGTPGWTRQNPYSLSAAPDGRTLRITAAHVGDGSARLATLRPGARAYVEGPYGRLHAGARTRDKALLMGSGIGITPLRALLEDLPVRSAGDLVLVYRAHSSADLVLTDELQALADTRGVRVVTVLGRRRQDAPSWLPESATGVDDTDALFQLCPDLLERDLYLCGNPAWMDAIVRAARRGGMDKEQIHFERFTY